MTPEEKKQLKRYLKGGSGASPEEQQRLVELMKANEGELQAKDEPVVDPELGVRFGPWLGFTLWALPDRLLMPAWMIRMERRSPKAVVPFLAVFALMAQMHSFALPVGVLLIIFPQWIGLPSLKDFDAIQAATPSAGIISLVDFAIVGIIGLIGSYWVMGTVPPKRIRFLYGGLLFPPLLAALGMLFMAAPQRSRSGIFLISHFLDRSGGKEELFTVVDDFTRDKALICKSTFTCTTRKFRIARVSAPQDTWEIGVEQLTKAVRKDIAAKPPFRIWGKVRHGIPGLPTLDIRSVRLDDSIHGYVGEEQYWGSYRGKFQRIPRPFPFVQLKGKFVMFVYLPSTWPKPEAKEIMDWLRAIDATGHARVAKVEGSFDLNFGGEYLYDHEKPVPFIYLSVNWNLMRACKFIDEHEGGSHWGLADRESDETALGLFGLCLLDHEGLAVFEGDLRKKEDRATAIKLMIVGRHELGARSLN